jgi:aflatoxin B1 aldehyde reductase
MAGGLLAKTPDGIVNGKGRWDPSLPGGKIYQYLYNKPSYLKMLEEYGALCEKISISRAALAMRWVKYHSGLDGALGDWLIIGATSTQQLEETLVNLHDGPLEPWVVDRLDELWKMVEKDSPVDNLEALKALNMA